MSFNFEVFEGFLPFGGQVAFRRSKYILLGGLGHRVFLLLTPPHRGATR